MKISNIKINNFRGIKECDILLDGDTVLVGDNNSGKSTILEAIDLVLGPERLSRTPIINEHDFYAGEYLSGEKELKQIKVELTITGLSTEQETHFRNHIEWWNLNEQRLIDSPPAEKTDEDGVWSALRVAFIGHYDVEEDDFTGETIFMSPKLESGKYDYFGKKDKRICGFLYLRTLRTGSRALSFERGSLLDIILRIKELRPQMWEDVLWQLSAMPVADNSSLGIGDILESIQKAVRNLVPIEYADAPRIRMSKMTREHLRQILTIFLETGATTADGEQYSAPFYHQGTGTINTLVLALLSMIAVLKDNVIFAMEEPEIALPPHTQKRVIRSVISKSAQAIFTSHSPFVLEEFKPERIMVVHRKNGVMSAVPATYPPSVKPKKYKEEVKRRFCESLLARRVLVVEGRTEFDAITSAAYRLEELEPNLYMSLDVLGIAIIDAEGEKNVLPLINYFKGFDKAVYAALDKQDTETSLSISKNVTLAFEASEKGMEDVVLNGTTPQALKRYVLSVVASGEWPSHLPNRPTESTANDEVKELARALFKGKKGENAIADFLSQCELTEIPQHLKDMLSKIKDDAVKISEIDESSAEDDYNEDEPL